MNLSRSSPVHPARKVRFTLRRTALIHSLGAARSSFERAKKRACRTISGPGFNRRNRLAQLKCAVTASCCASGRFFFAEIIARFHYDGDDKIPAVSVIVPLFNEEENVTILQSELHATLGGIDHEIIFVDDGSVDR